MSDPTLLRDREGEAEARRKGLREFATTTVMFLILVGVVLALLTIDSWWPQQLLPWPEVSRL